MAERATSTRPGGRTATPAAALVAVGLDPDRGRDRLVELGLWSGDGPTAEGHELLEVISEAASPPDALHVLAELGRNQPHVYDRVRADRAWLHRLVAVAGASRPLGDLLARHADAVESLREPQPVHAAGIAEQVKVAIASTDGDDRAAAVAGIRRRTTAAIAARDLTGELDVEQVGWELARLADGVLAGATAALHDELGGERPTARLCVIGMGKLGGEELNYVSDVDVVFVHAPRRADASNQDARAAREEAQQVFTALLRLLNASTTMGRAYEIDPTLRPEGREGALSRTVPSFVAYWERWAKTWEFQAMLKARPVAGDLALGQELLDAAEPFVYPENLDPSTVSQVRDMKGRVEAKDEVVRHGQRHLKLAPGGLRDIEFAVQLLQLVHARGDPTIRQRGTVRALAALGDRGYIAVDDAETFSSAYRRLRTVEHRLQLAEERRTHTVPDDPDRQECLARSLGYRPTADRRARAAFLEELRSLQGNVRDLHAKLFYRPLLEMHAAVPASDAALVEQRTGVLSEDAALRRLEALGFRDARGVLRDVRALTAGVSRRATTLRMALPAMLHALAESPDPDGGVRGLRTLVEAHGDDAALVAALRDQPPVADLLARLLGTSEVAGELLLTVPQGVEWLTNADARAQPRLREDLVRTALGMLRWQEDLAGRQAALRRFKRREQARIVIRDLAGDASVTAVGAELAALGDACLEAGLQAVLDAVRDAEGTGDGDPASIAVIGLGKLGGRELHYPSDLDVMVVHGPTPDDGDAGGDERRASVFAVEVAERLLPALSSATAEGTAFDVDAELRPEGRSGPLSRSLASCRAYYERWAEPWERQALLKARRVAGDMELGRSFVALAQQHAYPQVFGTAEATAVRRMKARIERERIPRRVDPKRHLKLGAGGLTDVEWTVQLLQQQHGAHEPMLRTPSTMAGVDALQDVGILDATEATWLRDGYRFLATVRNRLYLLRQRDVDVLPTAVLVLEKLARSLGYGRNARQVLEDDYLRHTRHIRRVTERRFYGRT
ncbi:MAG: bifunctional [glutamine synthetase] adenylyltransferase/[glutamine synthetase]-adenylyl-L-tyrosine phosphorylase [Actinobacteria bacterium]|nr:bifunctional [glutamine synthetase] adenylyltransferase/[glutamine synthetase]-adenylyl-L-tyrosine phosphorylase [Actinomycetota bacterium]